MNIQVCTGPAVSFNYIIKTDFFLIQGEKGEPGDIPHVSCKSQLMQVQELLI